MDEQNPYAVTSTATEYESPGAGEGQPRLYLASRGKRFANFIIDYIGYLALSFVVGFVIGLALALTGQAQMLESIPELLLGIGSFLLYYVPQELIFGRTLGKMVTGTRVVSADGGKPTAGQIIGRTFARMIPFEPFSFFGGDGYPAGWHDRLSKTRVVEM